MNRKWSRRDWLKASGLAAGALAAGSTVRGNAVRGAGGTPATWRSYLSAIPVRHEVDVFVAGGGPAGTAAAVSARKLGASVFLAEAHTCFGGMGTAARSRCSCPSATASTSSPADSAPCDRAAEAGIVAPRTGPRRSRP